MTRLSQSFGHLYDAMFEHPYQQWPQRGIVLQDKYLGFNVHNPKNQPKMLGNMVVSVVAIEADKKVELSFVPTAPLHGLCLGQKVFDTDQFSIISLEDDTSGKIKLTNSSGLPVEHGLNQVEEDAVFVALGIAVAERMSRDNARETIYLVG